MPTKTKPVTPEEAKAMEGTEFIYEFSDGDTIPAFVKKFDPEIGLTCMTLEAESTRDGYQPTWQQDREADGTWCVVGHQFRLPSHTLEGALSVLTFIRDTGRYRVGSANGISVGGTTSCGFL